MSFVDPVGDMITRIRNAQLRALNNVTIPSSKFRAKILDVLKQEGYIANYKILSDLTNNSELEIATNKIIKNKVPDIIIHNIGGIANITTILQLH